MSRRAKAILVMVLVVGLAATPVLVLHARTSAKIRKHFDGLKADGVPVTLEEVTKSYRSLGEAENGAPHYEKAFAALVDTGSLENRTLIGRGTKFDPVKVLAEDRKRLEGVLKANSVFYTYLGEAARRKRAAYDLQWEAGFHMLVKHLKGIGSSFRALELQALFAADRGDRAAVIRNLELVLTLADSIREEPILISVLVRARGMSTAAALTEAALQLGKPSEEEFRRLEELWEGRELRAHFLASMKYGRWTISKVFRGTSSELVRVMEEGGDGSGTDSAGIAVGMSLLSFVGAKKGDYLYFLERFRELEKAWETERMPLDEVDRLLMDLEMVRSETGSAVGMGLSMNASRVKIISGMILPGELKAAEKVVGTELEINLVHAGLAVARQQARTGEVPEKISEVEGMEGAWLNDVFSGGEITVDRGEEGVTLYSVGRNREDDGGVREGTSKDDIAFFVRHW